MKADQSIQASFKFGRLLSILYLICKSEPFWFQIGLVENHPTGLDPLYTGSFGVPRLPTSPVEGRTFDMA